MIPAFDDNGYLPPGIHLATLEEVTARFGVDTEMRQAQAQSLEWLLPMCRDLGIRRLIINGSFVTDVPEPNDVDCVLLRDDAYDEGSPAAVELEEGLPFLSIQVVRRTAFDFLSQRFFATDRDHRPKGVVEILL